MPIMQRAVALPVRRRLRGDDAAPACQRDGDERRLLGCGAGEVGEMTDDGRAMWVNCKQCEHVWVALRLPMEMSKAAKVMIKLRCPNCAADAKKIRVGKGESDAVDTPTNSDERRGS
jgi:hypothetical protein